MEECVIEIIKKLRDFEDSLTKDIVKRDKGLDNFRPNKKDVKNPKSEYLLKEFQYIVLGKILLQNANIHYFVSELKDLQNQILEILEVPSLCFTYDYLFGGRLQIPGY